MVIRMRRVVPGSLDRVVSVVAGWQCAGGPVQLHPGDLGWNWFLGTRELAAAVRVWTRGRRILAVGLVDSGLIRMGLAPSVDDDAGFAARLHADLTDPVSGVLPGGVSCVEARFGAAFRDVLRRGGWVADEPWTPMSRDLAEPVEACGLRVEALDARRFPDRILQDRVAVQRAAFAGSAFTRQRWHTMAAAPPYRRAPCLVGYGPGGDAVAAVTVWSAGPGRPGLIEPMGVHRDHRGRGFGRAITVAAAAALQEIGSCSAVVCTPSSNIGGVATYVSAGFRKLPEVADFRRTSAGV